MENQTVTSESPATPTSLPQRSSFKTFLLGLSFVLFGVLLGVLIDRFLLSVSLQPGSEINPTPTASISATPTAVITPATLATQNWQTYTDPQKLYTVKYPVATKLDSSVKPSIDITFLGPTQKPQTEFYDGYKVTISYETLSSSQTPAAIVNKIYQQATDSCPVPEKVILSPLAQITISGEPAWQYSVQDCFGDATISYAAHSGKLFSLSSVYMGPTSDTLHKYQAESSQIISTFQFVTSQTSYTCPATEWVDCMPSTDSRPRPQCSREFLDWARANCPGFQGAAL